MRKLSMIPYMGGKHRLQGDLTEIIESCATQFQIDTYIEYCVGAGNVLLNLSPFEHEIINDMDPALINLWAVVKDANGCLELIDRLEQMPCDREAFEEARNKLTAYDNGMGSLDMLTCAAYAYLVAKMSRCADMESYKYYKDDEDRNDKEQELYYKNIYRLEECQQRLTSVDIMQGDCMDLLREYADRTDIVGYIDPPYVHTGVFRYNLNDKLQRQLVEVVSKSKNKLLISGYENTIYTRLVDEFGWQKQLLDRIPVLSSSNNGGCRQADEFIWTNF